MKKKTVKKSAKREPLARVESEEYGWYTIWIGQYKTKMNGANKEYFMEEAEKINAAAEKWRKNYGKPVEKEVK